MGDLEKFISMTTKYDSVLHEYVSTDRTAD